jgi:large subunit ribosomal protein L25
MAQSAVLKAQKRLKLGTRSSRALRVEGLIPANIQGGGEHVNVSISEHEFLATRRAHVHLYDIDIEGTQETAVVRELQWDVFGDSLVHIEFMKVVRGVEIGSEVSLAFTGHPKSGVINHLVESVQIRCIPSLIPDNLEVVVEGLEEGSHLKVSDLLLPEGITLDCDPDMDVATIVGAHGHERDEEEITEEGISDLDESTEDAPEEPEQG